MSAACCLSFFHVCCCWWGWWCVCCELPRTVRLNRVGVKKVNFFPNPVFKSISICQSSKNDKSKHCHLSSLRKRSKLWNKGGKKKEMQMIFTATLLHHSACVSRNPNRFDSSSCFSRRLCHVTLVKVVYSFMTHMQCSCHLCHLCLHRAVSFFWQGIWIAAICLAADRVWLNLRHWSTYFAGSGKKLNSTIFDWRGKLKDGLSTRLITQPGRSHCPKWRGFSEFIDSFESVSWTRHLKSFWYISVLSPVATNFA